MTSGIAAMERLSAVAQAAGLAGGPELVALLCEHVAAIETPTLGRADLLAELAARLIEDDARLAGHDLDDARAAIEQVTGKAVPVDAASLETSRRELGERAVAELPPRP